MSIFVVSIIIIPAIIANNVVPAVLPYTRHIRMRQLVS